MKRHVRDVHQDDDEITTVKDKCGPLQHPFTMLVVGPTGSGKTRWLQQMLQHQFLEPKPSRIVWCYAQWQGLYSEIQASFPQVEFVQGLPDNIMQQWQPDKTNLLILDDLMAQMDERVAQLYTQGSHHLNLSVITVLQNLFPKGKDPRTVSLNAHYIVLFKNPRDCLQVATLGAQMYPGNGNKLLRAYKQATKEPYSYMLVDLKQDTPDHCRLRTHIFETSNQSPPGPTPPPGPDRPLSEPDLTFADASGNMVLRMLNRQLLDWNERGEMIAAGRVVPGSSLVALIEYLLKPQGLAPEGWTTFLAALERHQLIVLNRMLPDITGYQIVERLSPVVQSVAEYILEHVGPNHLGWNRYWRAVLFGKVIPDSNIVQLFQYVLSHDLVQPVGLEPFMKALKAGRIKTAYLVNPRALQVYKQI